MRITSYSFGNIDIDNKRYKSDLKIINGQVKPDWWRAEGHRLNLSDIQDIIEARPDILVIGTGYSGLMKVSQDLADSLSKHGITIEAHRSGKAVDRFTQLVEKHGHERVALAIHLTC